MKWGENKNYRNNPCRNCTKERMTKVDGKYIRCDMNCPERDAWKAQQEAEKAAKNERIHIAETIRELEHKRCSTKRRRAV